MRTQTVIPNQLAIVFFFQFPLLSKSSKLQKLVLKATSEGTDEIYLPDFPGGPKAFDICAKFCYGMVVTLNPYNVVPARCAAEYLEMTETVEKGNLIFKIEVFLNSSIFRSWKDTIIVLQSAKNLFPWSEELKIVGRCIDSIAAKTSVDPSNVTWSYTYSKKMNLTDEIVETVEQRIPPKDWWVEDLCELDVDFYKRVMVAIKSKGRMSADLIGEALRTYAVRWLPDRYDALVGEDYAKRNRVLVETIIWLLPSYKGPSGCSCRFLLKLLKVAILVGAGEGIKEELVNRISIQLHKASPKDLLLPVRSGEDGEGENTMYDVALVIELVRRYMARNGDVQGGYEKEMIELSVERDNSLALGELVDGFLCEVASDPNLGIDKFVELVTTIPEIGRPIHDGLYTAIDIYLKVHTL
jgi:NPH3 family